VAHFRVVANQFDCKGEVYKKGQIFETHLDLGKKAFKGIVERVDPAILTAPPVVSRVRVPTPQPLSVKELQVDALPEVPTGIDVTNNFPKAKTANLVVKQTGDLYFIYSEEDNTASLNPQGLKKGQVNQFISKLH